MCNAINCYIGFSNNEDIVVLYLTKMYESIGSGEYFHLNDEEEKVYHIDCFNKLGANFLNRNPEPIMHIY